MSYSNCKLVHNKALMKLHQYLSCIRRFFDSGSLLSSINHGSSDNIRSDKGTVIETALSLKAQPFERYLAHLRFS